ncbi:hypothetical protein V7S43_009073 [Phytophthora oleae]|uniref:Uncharacterized protein n=1 Tax=Phytophthora oleae TaxID=2107226 RepID=A0ABD3FGU7_9STRA
MSVWKFIALRQLEARENAEKQQRRLCQDIEAQDAHIRELQELSQRIANDVGLIFDDLQTNSEIASTIPFCKLFVQDLDGVHAQTEDCLRGFDEFSPVKVWEENYSGCFQYTDRHELCCDFEQACQTLWDAVKLRHRHECRQEFHHVPDPDTTSAFNFRVSNRLSSGQVVSALQRVVSRQYRTRDRLVFVWQSYMDGEGMFTGLCAGETGWDVLTRSVDAFGLEKVTRTSIICHTSIHFANTVIPEAVAKEFTTMTIGSVMEDGDEIARRFQEINIAV